MKLNNKGSIAIEIVLVLVVVSILYIVISPKNKSYNVGNQQVTVQNSISYVKKSEGEIVLSMIKDAEQAYYSIHGKYYSVSKTSSNSAINVDLRSNKYFTSFEVSLTDKGFIAITHGTDGTSGISLTATN